MFDTHKTRMIGLPYGEKNYDNTLSRFHRISERNGQTDRQTGLQYQYRASVSGWRGGLVVGRRTCDLVVAGSRPGRDAAA